MLTFNTVNKNNNLHTYKCICTNERTISEIKLTYFFLKDDGPDAGIYDSTEDGIVFGVPNIAIIREAKCGGFLRP